MGKYGRMRYERLEYRVGWWVEAAGVDGVPERDQRPDRQRRHRGEQAFQQVELALVGRAETYQDQRPVAVGQPEPRRMVRSGQLRADVADMLRWPDLRQLEGTAGQDEQPVGVEDLLGERSNRRRSSTPC
jgi:hypothetical protein